MLSFPFANCKMSMIFVVQYCWTAAQIHHHQSLNREDRWGTTDDFATNFLHFSLFSTALWDLPNSRPVQSLMVWATDIGLKFGTSPKSHHVDDAESSPVRAETFTDYPTAKNIYRLNFL